jgi:nitrous oxide reductase accessory protein NosL
MRRFVALLIVLLLAGCSGEPDTGPGKVRWDREVCVRCAMAVSDHNYSAQVRGGAANQKHKLYKFDDIGCAAIWLDQQPWKDDPSTEVWVTDYRNGEWIDARKAWYVSGKVTPMAYGLGASSDKEDGAMDFAAAKKHIYAVEEQTHTHRGDAHAHTGSGE